MKGIHKLRKHSLGHLRCWRYLLFLICSQACPVLQDWPSHPSLPFYLFSSQSSQVYKHPWEKPMLGNSLSAGARFIPECWRSVPPGSLASVLQCSLTTSRHTLQEQSQVSNAFPPTVARPSQRWFLVFAPQRTFPTPSVLWGQGTPNSLLASPFLWLLAITALSWSFYSPSLPSPLPTKSSNISSSFSKGVESIYFYFQSVLFSTISEFLTSTFVSYHF